MNRKVIKYFFELCFIFVIPLLIICLNCNYSNEIVYDNNGNFQSTEKHIEFSTPFSYINDLEYINYLNFNQLFNLKSDYTSTVLNVSVSINENFKIKFVGTPSTTGGRLSYKDLFNQTYISIKNNHKYLFLTYGDYPSNTYFYLNDLENNAVNTLSNNTIYTSNIDKDVIFGWNFNDTTTTYNNEFYINLIDLTEMYGVGYEPTIDNFKSLFNQYYYNYNVGEVISIESDSIISDHYITNYTIWGRLKNSFTEGLELQDNFVLDFIITYTILWFTMFLIWHIIYLLFDKLFHLRRE